MAESETLRAKKREARGTKACRRLREEGQIPAIVYGHEQEPVAVQVSAEDLDRALRHRSRMFDIRLGRKKESVLLRDIQHDALGDEVIHADFVRVAMDEAIAIEVPITLKGKTRAEHAVLQQTLASLEVECLPSDIPEEILAPVGDLEVGQSISVADLVMPESVKVLTDAETIVAALTLAVIEEVPVEEAAATIEAFEEPEVIGREEEAAADAEKKEAEGA
ncbi:MAG: 50S ribosomal protein L25 [Planctomycetota bacterium]|nr:50S ribosomal protein L25 [Planctomycetota bacterium]